MTTRRSGPWTRWAVTGAATFAAATAVHAAAPSGAEPLREVQRIELPGVEGRIDHLAIDHEGQRLFVAVLGADEVDVVDLKVGQRVARLTGFREPQGVAYLAPLRRLLVAAGESGKVFAFEGDKQVGVAAGLADADNVRFFASTGRLYVGYGSGLAIIDPMSLAVVARIALPGHPEAFELAERGPEIFVNVPTAGRIVVVDRRDGKTTATWDVGPERRNFPMALDEVGHRLFIGTREPPRLLVYDTTTGRRVAQSPLCGDVDDVFFDGDKQQLIAVCGKGTVDVLPWRAGDRLEPAMRVATSPGARTGLFVPEARTLYVAAPGRFGHAAAVIAYRLD